jgi:hypothetical protein
MNLSRSPPENKKPTDRKWVSKDLICLELDTQSISQSFLPRK